MTVPAPLAWNSGSIRILDQTLLPSEERYVQLTSLEEVARAIETLAVRGAPLIGIAAAYGVALAVARRGSGDAGKVLAEAVARLQRTRPTAVNLQHALGCMEQVGFRTGGDADALLAEAQRIHEEDAAMCRRIGEVGLPLVPDGAIVMTICNAGVLATGGIGTALAPVYLAHEAGRRVEVIVPETRPLLQGARLTAWELSRSGIACTLIADGMVAPRLRRADVTCVLTGADRIAANGDFANKVGTYGLALAARAHAVPFFVAAPGTTVDLETPTGDAIPIEARDTSEVTGFGGYRTAPDVPVWNPAFDVTPASLVSAFLTDRGRMDPAQLAWRFAA
ncbi:MAG TPA: S-methyl-5-thioribose-1-phosphate isomerase [Gemmatimonadales bacterium]|nr:S-methyl-5-thioribose-1-phosphate isomerase [Gemmatimonadales bacterium]